MEGIQSLAEVMWWASWLTLALAVFCFARAIYDAFRAVLVSRIKASGETGGGSPMLAELVADDSSHRYGWMSGGWATAGVVLSIAAYQLRG